MRKGFITVLFALLLGVFSPLASAQEDSALVRAARYYGADYQFYMAVRTDDGYLSDLNSVINRILGNLPADVAGMLPAELDIRQLIDSQVLASAPVKYADIRAFLGDTLSVGIRDIAATQDGNPQDAGFQVVVELSDAAAFQAFLEQQARGALPTPSQQGEFTVYEVDRATVLAVGPAEVIITTDPAGLVSRIARLNSSEGFNSAVNALPADNYNIVMYVNYAALFTSMPEFNAVFPADMLELLPRNAAVGFTILDASTLTIDISADTAAGVDYLKPVNPDFAAFIPGDTDLVVHSSNLNGYFEYLLTTLGATYSQLGVDLDVEAEVEKVFDQIRSASQIDVREDVLSWMNADYALYGSADLLAFLELMETIASDGRVPMDAGLPLEFGLVIATDNPTRTAETVTKLGTLLSAVTARQENVRVAEVSERGFNGYEITLTIPVAGPSRFINYDILIGSDSAVFFLGSATAAERVLAGDNLTATSNYANAGRYILPDAVSVGYTDDEGVDIIVGGLASLVVLGPTINNVFESITDELSGTGGSGSSSSPSSPSPEMMMQQFRLVLAVTNSLFDNTTISSAVSGSFTLGRATLTLK
jgi:hypothetical protein